MALQIPKLERILQSSCNQFYDSSSIDSKYLRQSDIASLANSSLKYVAQSYTKIKHPVNSSDSVQGSKTKKNNLDKKVNDYFNKQEEFRKEARNHSNKAEGIYSTQELREKLSKL